MNKSPVFIHSLFRSGSTYIFETFRRSKSGYWCYQEALHEIAFSARNNPGALRDHNEEEKEELLRHPHLSSYYFKELYNAWPSWKDSISEESIYDSYFSPLEQDIGVNYFSSLIDASKGRPVFQECRTALRIASLKEALGGIHCYLWRNPWDQWWSYKVADYFTATNQLILNASAPHDSVVELRKNISIANINPKKILDSFTIAEQHSLTSEENYSLFYLLWSLTLNHGLRHADLLINIDKLSDSHDYREQILNELDKESLSGLDFSDCSIPQSYYLPKEKEFFSKIEHMVHDWLKIGGWTQDEVDEIINIRQNFHPNIWSSRKEDFDTHNLSEQISRAHQLVIRYETKLAVTARQDASLFKASENRNKLLEEKYSSITIERDQAKTHLENLENERKQLTAQVKSFEVASQKMNERINNLEAEFEKRMMFINALENEQQKHVEYIKNLENERDKRSEHIKNLVHEQEKHKEHIKNLENEREKRSEYIKNLENERDKRNEHVNNLENEREKRNEHVKNLENEREKRNEHIKNLIHEQQQRIDHVKNLENERETRIVLLNKLEYEKQQLDIQLNALKDIVKNAQVDNETFSTTIVNLEHEKSTMLESANILSRDLQKLKQDLNTLDNEKNGLFIANQELNDKLNKVNSRNSSLQHANTQQQSQIQMLQNEISIFVNSKSWKITSPLRNARAILSRLKPFQSRPASVPSLPCPIEEKNESQSNTVLSSESLPKTQRIYEMLKVAKKYPDKGKP